MPNRGAFASAGGALLTGSFVALAVLVHAAPATGQCRAGACERILTLIGAPEPAAPPAADPATAPTVEPPSPTPSGAGRVARASGLGMVVVSRTSLEGASELLLFGFGAALRYVAGPNFGLEVAVDAAGTSDSWAVPIQLSGLVFLNIARRVQPVLAFGADVNVVGARHVDAALVYSGGHVGVGVEILLGPALGILVEVRQSVLGLVDGGALQRRFEQLEYGTALRFGVSFGI